MKKKSSQKKNKNDNSKLFYFLAVVILLSASLLYSLPNSEWSQEKILTVTKDLKGYAKNTSQPTITPTKETPSVTNNLPRLAIIIDDIGHNRRYDNFIEIGMPITLSVMPSAPYTRKAAQRGETAGFEIMLHVPMEPKGYPEKDPGKDALLISMDKEALLKQFIEDLEAVPYIKGVNNHMGSRFTEDVDGMEVVLKEIKKRGLFFVDSKTSAKSVGYSIAKSMGIRTAERTVFIDNDKTEEAIRAQLMKAVQIAKSNGEALAIGHPYEETVVALRKLAPVLKNEDVELVFASTITR